MFIDGKMEGIMVRRGYSSELKAKKELEQIFGFNNVIKVAIGGATDFITVCLGELIKVVEVKECHKKKFYASKREKEQMKRIIKFAKQHKITAELWLYYPTRGKATIKQISILYAPETFPVLRTL